jgi:LysM repeat protein
MFIRATYDRENKTVRYFDKDGYETQYIGGSFAWRTNNPGNLIKPSSYVMQDAIGYAQRTSSSKSLFVIFPNRNAGHQAHLNVVKRIYRDSTVAGMITKYAPPSENDTQTYIDQVTSKAKVSSKDIIGTLSDEKLGAVSAAMEQQEGNIPGVIKTLGKSVQVTLLDRSHNALSNQKLHIKTADKTIITQTDKHGVLPLLHADLIKDDISLYYSREKEDLEHIGDIIVNELKELYTFIAPYQLISIRPQVHQGDAPRRPPVHIVRPHETLSGIASRYATTVDALVRENHLSSPDRIYARQHLKVPSAQSSESSPQSHRPVPGREAPKAGNTTHSSSNHAYDIPAKKTTAGIPASVGASGTASAGQDSHVTKSDSVSHQRNPNGHPETVVSATTLELSGRKWCARFPGSASLDSLNAQFRPKASAFIAALQGAGATVRINAALRPNERSYLMHSAFNIAKGAIGPENVQPYRNVNIDWVHRNDAGDIDLQGSKKAAQQMCEGYGINPFSKKQKVARPATSRHNFGAAVDLNIQNFAGKKIKDASGDEIDVKSFDDLIRIGTSYGVIYFSGENMHWSDNGR